MWPTAVEQTPLEQYVTYSGGADTTRTVCGLQRWSRHHSNSVWPTAVEQTALEQYVAYSGGADTTLTVCGLQRYIYCSSLSFDVLRVTAVQAAITNDSYATGIWR
jgi:predicted PP-loop superfamily ATPase